MWKAEREGHYFKIYDKKKNIAGYFAPEYGEIYPEDKADEIIDQMHKRHERIKSGYLMVPMVKFGIFEEGREMDIGYIIKQLEEAKTRLSYWMEFISQNGIREHKVRISHTDHDMLSITLHLSFEIPVSLERDSVQDAMGGIFDNLQETGLL
ncbi:MAG: hypothetical protein KGI33_01170 [Thaumarchaeota archaeon]|nr:hypothetical protein [Nitrososphaerota archaeon]